MGLVRIGIILVAGLGDAADDEFAAECSHRLFDADAFGHLAYLGRGALFVGKEVGHSVDIRLSRGRARCGESIRRGSAGRSIGSGYADGGRGVVLSVGRYRLGGHDFDHAIGALFLRIHRFEGEQDLAVEGGKVGFELLQLVLLFPDFPDNLFQDGEFLLNGFVVLCVFLYQAGDAIEGVDEVLAGGFRIDCQAAVVVIVEEVAFATHEETVLTEVQTVLDGGVGLDKDVEAIERTDDLRLAVRAL